MRTSVAPKRKAGSVGPTWGRPFCTQAMPPAPLKLLTAPVPLVGPVPIHRVTSLRAMRRYEPLGASPELAT